MRIKISLMTNQLSKEEQEEIAKSLDVDKIKADAKRLETQLQAQG
ncbi:Gram-positive cocci surface proteins LPxTG domain-containing protein OS=Lysinibacillus sphaericus OX=1421 GN=LS41612_20325 PE=4 SV=1 [Lysinibacillus sphaericus]